MSDYSNMSDDELNKAIHKHIGARGIHLTADTQDFRAYPDYLHDDSATWRALNEMPVDHIMRYGENDEWMIDLRVMEANGDIHLWDCGLSDYTLSRAVWLTWLAWHEGGNA